MDEACRLGTSWSLPSVGGASTQPAMGDMGVEERSGGVRTTLGGTLEAGVVSCTIWW